MVNSGKWLEKNETLTFCFMYFFKHFATAGTTFANIGLYLALYIENILHL